MIHGKGYLKAIALTVITASSLTGCVLTDDAQSNSIRSRNQIVFNQGTSIKSSVKYIANKFDVSNINLGSELLNNNQYLTEKVVISNYDTPELAIAKIFKNSPNLTAIISNDGDTLNVINKNKSDLLSDSSIKLKSFTEINKTKTDIVKMKKLKRGEVLANEINEYISNTEYNVVWLLSDELSRVIKKPLTINVELNESSINEFLKSTLITINDITGQNVYITICDDHIIFHEFGSDNANVYNVKEGLLSENVKALSEKYGWKFSINDCWKTNKDFQITVSYPLVSKNNFRDSLTQLLKPYADVLKFKILNTNEDNDLRVFISEI